MYGWFIIYRLFNQSHSSVDWLIYTEWILYLFKCENVLKVNMTQEQTLNTNTDQVKHSWKSLYTMDR